VQIALHDVLGPQMLNSVQSNKATVIHSLCFYSLHSKCPPLSFMQAFGQLCHCLMAQSMTDWSSHSHNLSMCSHHHVESSFRKHRLSSFPIFSQKALELSPNTISPACLKDDMQWFFTKLMQKSFLAAYCNINPSV